MRLPFLEAGALAVVVDAVPFDFAHLARCAAAIFARASGDIVRLPRFLVGEAIAAGCGTEALDELPTTILASSDLSCWICSAMARARLSWLVDGVDIAQGLTRQ